ncbi:MAG: sulfite exporter TauE/SafE family protein [Pseudomonadota bacterium]
MPEGLMVALSLPGTPIIVAITLIAGIVYGFAGFGAALVFLPVASIAVDPATAIAAFSLGALSSLITLVPKAWAVCDKRVTLLMIAAATLTLPLGIYVLRVADPQTMQFAISVLAGLTLLALVTGFRLPVRPGATASTAVAGAAGVVGGATGLLGPLVILFNLASGDEAARVRANTLIFLTLGSLFVLPQMAFQGLLTAKAMWLGVILLPVYGIGTVIGRRLFNPAHEGVYRLVAYAIIALAVVAGLQEFL